jgi:hypothetical protein
MNFAFYLLGIFCVYALLIQHVAVGAKAFNRQTIEAVGPLKLLTRRAHRWNTLTRVPERRPYEGYREAYLENRSAVYYLFDVVPVFFRFYQVEIAMNDIIRVMTIGDSLDGKKLDKHFPDHLAYGEHLGKGNRMQGMPLAGNGF